MSPNIKLIMELAVIAADIINTIARLSKSEATPEDFAESSKMMSEAEKRLKEARETFL